MKNVAWVSIIVALALTQTGSSATAGLFGGLLLLPAHRRAPVRRLLRSEDVLPDPCAPCTKRPFKKRSGRNIATYCCKTVYDNVCEQVPYTARATCGKRATKTSATRLQAVLPDVLQGRLLHGLHSRSIQTCYRDVCYTVCKPCYPDLLPGLLLHGLQADTTRPATATSNCTTYKTERECSGT